MDIGRREAFKKAVRISAIGSSVLLISCLALRSVYAITFFNVMTRTMQSSAHDSIDQKSAVQINEEMTFEASYLFLKIGSVRFQVLGKTEYDSVPAYHLRACVDSYSWVPFVNFHAVYDTYADAKNLFCLFDSRSQEDGHSQVYTSTNLDFNKKNITWEQTRDGKTVREVNLPMDTNYTNGVSLVYFLRKLCQDADGKQMKLDVPIIDDTVQSSISLTINEKKEVCRVTAFDFPLEAYRLSGHVNFVGTFGLSGDFEGWMAAASSAVPLKANVKVLLGSVVVQLKEIKGNNWTPPRLSGSE